MTTDQTDNPDTPVNEHGNGGTAAAPDPAPPTPGAGPTPGGAAAPVSSAPAAHPPPPGARDPRAAAPATHRLGMTILIASLSVLFASSLLVYWFLRMILFKGQWPPAGYQPLPVTIWLSTGLLAISSYTIERGRAALRDGRASGGGGLAGMMLVSAIIGWLFLVAQSFNWAELLGAYAAADVPINREQGIHAMMFILLTALHAAHVLGGVIPLTVIAVRSRHGAYPPPANGTVDAMAVYWHFLGIVWLVMFVTIFLPGG